MKNLVKIGACIGIATITALCVYVAIFYYRHPQETSGDQYVEARSGSDSMEPTIMIGDTMVTHIGESPKIGDMVAFWCLSGDCGLESSDPGVPTVHRLTNTDAQGCMTIIGDNPKYDWSQVPCYMPDDIKILGVVRKL